MKTQKIKLAPLSVNSFQTVITAEQKLILGGNDDARTHPGTHTTTSCK